MVSRGVAIRIFLNLASFFDYEYIREYAAQIGTARNAEYGTYAEPISAKTPENPPRCHVPLTGKWLCKFGRTSKKM
jgi:hypothetical protein